MSSTANLAALEPELVILAVLVLVMARRAVSMVRGTTVQPARLFVFAAFYTGLFVLTVSLDEVGTPWYYYVLDAAIVGAASVIATRYIREHVHLEQRPPDSQWYYRLHPGIAVAYLVLFVTRMAVAIWALGPDALDFLPTSAPALSPATFAVLRLVDALFAASTGILVGRSVGVYLAYERKVSAAPDRPLTSAPPSSP